MRVKAPEGKGHPVLRGLEVKPEDDGCYHVSAADGRLLVDTHGYIDADAPPKTKAKAKTDGSAVHKAAVAALEAFGVKLADPSEEVVARALADLPGTVKDRMLAAVERAEKDTEDRVLKELAADKSDSKKK